MISPYFARKLIIFWKM